MLNTFQQVDLSKNFYFSYVCPSLVSLRRHSLALNSSSPRYSYDITNTLQTNLTVSASNRNWNTRFMWNHHLLSPAFDLEEPKGRSRWILPLIHGFVDQASECCFLPIEPTLQAEIDLRRDRSLHEDCVPHVDREAVETLRRCEVPDPRGQRAGGSADTFEVLRQPRLGLD
jgi:hypothetical protein